MKKNGKTPPGPTPPTPVANEDNRTRTYITARGVRVTLRAAPPMIETAVKAALETEWREEGRLPQKPTYEIQTAAGETETHEHDEKTIADDSEAARAWLDWQAATAAFSAELFNRTRRAFIVDCLEFEIDPGWEKKARAKKLRVPEDEWERKVFYAETEVLGHADDFIALMTIPAELAGVPAQQLVAVREAFRRQMEVRQGQAAGDAQAKAAR